ncbi:MAG: TPM domain-containing protein [Bacteroidetes bacterium]|nr:MAG: TPM domain-containing protein [Bacteroidota bacterium]
MVSSFFTSDQQSQIISAIKEAELATSGEVRVHIENHCKKEVLERAAEVFANLNMHKTVLRNGVLFYLAVKDKKFAILGDVGINKVVPANFWDAIKSNTIEKFKKDDFANGLSEAIIEAGKQLKINFPYQSDDINELPDDISFSNN